MVRVVLSKRLAWERVEARLEVREVAWGRRRRSVMVLCVVCCVCMHLERAPGCRATFIIAALVGVLACYVGACLGMKA